MAKHELAAAAAGARLVFVQTHADEDDDIRDDWRKVLGRRYSSYLVFFATLLFTAAFCSEIQAYIFQWESSRFNFGLFDGHVGLFGVAALVQDYFVGEIVFLAGCDGGGVLDGAIVAALGRRAAAENGVAVE